MKQRRIYWTFYGLYDDVHRKRILPNWTQRDIERWIERKVHHHAKQWAKNLRVEWVDNVCCVRRIDSNKLYIRLWYDKEEV
jgi:hypothetical protein